MTTTPSNDAAAPPPASAPLAPPQQPPQPPQQPHEADDAKSADTFEPKGHEKPKGNEAEKTTTNGNDAADAPPPQPPQLDDDALLASFFAEVKAADRDAEVNRILGAFKLNPYEQLGARFDADSSELSRAYRRASLLVHPDKCSHPRASDAFDLLGAAAAALKEGAEGLEELRFVLDSAREQVRAERKKEAKKDGAARLAALIVDGGAAGVAAAWERSDQFHDRWRALARDLLARNEFKRRKLTLRLKETEERVAEEAKAERKKAKTERKSERAWERSREGRVGAWRDFAKKGGVGGGGSSSSSAKGTKARASAGGAAGKALPPKGVPSSWGSGSGVGGGNGASSSSAAGNAAAAPSNGGAASVRDPERPFVRRPNPESF